MLDPEQAHARAIRAAVDLKGLHVLEIGCGEGRLTFQLAPGNERWLATDPSEAAVEVARRSLPAELGEVVTFAVAAGDQVDAPEREFDLVLFSWSL